MSTALERDKLLVPEWLAASVVQEAERFLEEPLPDDFAARLPAKAYGLYPRHRHFHKMLNRPGNTGRNNLFMYMRHWTAGWLKRERSALYKRLPWSYAQGRSLPVTAPASPGITPTRRNWWRRIVSGPGYPLLIRRHNAPTAGSWPDCCIAWQSR